MYADILSRLFQIKKGVIINKTHVVVSPQQLILCTRFDKKSSEFIVNKKCTNVVVAVYSYLVPVTICRLVLSFNLPNESIHT